MKLSKIYAREYSVQYTEIAIRSLAHEVRDHVPMLVLSQAYLPEQGNEACYVDKEEWQRFLDALSKRYSKESTLKPLISRFHKYGKQYVATANRIGSLNLKQVKNEQLVKYYEQYQQSLITYTAYLWMGFFLNNIFSARVKKITEGKKIENSESILASLLLPSKRGGILALQDELLALRIKNGKLTNDFIKRILDKYKWMSCLDIHNEPWAVKDVREFFTHLNIPPKQLSFNEAVRLARLNKNELSYVRLTRELVYVKDMRDEYRRRGVFAMLPFFDVLAKQLKVARKEIAYFSSQEIIDVVKNRKTLDKAEATRRANGFLINLKGKDIQVTARLNKIKEFIQINVADEVQSSQSQQIKGITASIGRVQGRVKIVLGIRDLNKVKSGDVLVAITTHPDFVPAMHYASAIVTDEGGLTSHAAIVSRELKKPCIVGAKIATKVLKDGDLVEVDANSGVVKILGKTH